MIPDKKNTQQNIKHPAASPDALLQIILDGDPCLRPYADTIEQRLNRVISLEKQLMNENKSLARFASGHEYFGLHKDGWGWIFREWAPNATSIFLIGNMTDWKPLESYALRRISNDGVWEIHLPEGFLSHGDLYRLDMQWPEGRGDRIPAYARRVHQDPETMIFNAQVWDPPAYRWRHRSPGYPADPMLIYEAHIGMAQEEGKIGTYREFTERILPRIERAGYNTLQLMGIQEHPYYASFGYHVSNFFAASSRYGTPEDLKELIDTAHGAGLWVIMDIIHSHAVSNEAEGLSRFDGTRHQYFHDGSRGMHPAWD